MSTLALIGDAACLVGMSTAFVALALTRAVRPEDGGFTMLAKTSFMGVTAIYAYVAGASMVESVVPGFEAELYEGYLEMFAPVLALVGFYGACMSQRYRDLKSAEMVLAASHSFMVDLVDAAPAGILFLDPGGAIAFANSSAKEVLDLSEDERGWFTAPWKPEPGPVAQFAGLLGEQPHTAVPVTIEWPDGWRVELKLSTEVTRDANGRIGGYVLTFERPGPTARAAEAR